MLHEADLSKMHAYWGGEAAAEKLTRYPQPISFTIYTERSINSPIATCRLQAAATGNVEVLDVFWGFDPDPAYPDVVHPVLAYVYEYLLATHDGRNIEAAKPIYEKNIEPAFIHVSNRG